MREEYKKGGKAKDSRLKRAGVSGYNKPKRTPKHPTKSHVVVAKQGDKVKTIRFGQQGVKTAGKPKAGATTKHSLALEKDGKPSKKKLHIQVYNRETKSNPYELNHYIS